MIEKILILENYIWKFAFQNMKLVLLFSMFLTIYLSTIPGVVEEESISNTIYLWVPPNVQNTGHIVVYGILSILWCIYFTQKKLSAIQTFLTAFCITAIFGIFNEIAQFYIPGRDAVVSDALLNVIGAVLGGWIFNKRIKTLLKELKNDNL